MTLVDRALGLVGLQKAFRPTETLGGAGTPSYGGYLVETEGSSDLSGLERYRTYSNIIANCSIAAASIRYFLDLMSKADWRVAPAEDSGDAGAAIAELWEEAMYDMDRSWARVVRRAGLYRFYGFSVQEWTAKMTEDGTIFFKDVAPRAQATIERWQVDVHGKVEGAYQTLPSNNQQILIPREKMVYLVDDTLNDSPTGLGIMRHIVDAAKALKRFEQLEGIAFETDLRGIPVARAPLTDLNNDVRKNVMTANQRTKRLAPLLSFIKKHVRTSNLGLILDSDTYKTMGPDGSPSNVRKYDIELLKGDSTALPDLAKTIERLNHEIARVLGCEQLLLGQTRGTQALSRDKNDQLALLLESSLNDLQEAVEKDLLKTFMKLNGFPKELTPVLSIESLRTQDISEVTAALRDMATAGAVLDPLDPAIQEVRDMLGLSRTPEELLELYEERTMPTITTPKKQPVAEPPDDSSALEEDDIQEDV